MALSAFEDFAAPPLEFPIGDKLYRLPPVGMVEGIRLQAVIAGTDESLKDQPAEALWRLVMGSLWDEMRADNVPIEFVTRVALTALADFQYGRGMAEHVWETGISPEALAAPQAANREQRRTARKTAKKATPSRSTGGAARTPSPASTSGTKTSRPS